MTTAASARQHAVRVARALARAYPDARCALHHTNPLELLVATILSAQCTDKRVNEVTAALFRTYRTAADYAQAPEAELARAIQSTGFFRNKARNIRRCCQQLVEKHGGQVPDQLEALTALPGVGRKTANVVLGTAFGVASGVVVDTHVARLARRLGLTHARTPQRIEQELMAALPQREWIDFSHRMIQHGRKICTARKPKCEICPLARLCPKIGVRT